MRHQVDIVCFGPSRDLGSLRQTTNVADIDTDEVREPTLYVGQELPLAGELFADGEGNRRHLPQHLVSLG